MASKQNINITAGRISELLKNNNVQYWALQIIGWGGYAFFVMLDPWIHGKFASDQALYLIVATILGLLLSMAMRESFHLIWDYPPVKRGLLTLLSLGVAAGLWSQWKLYISYAISPVKEGWSMIYDSAYWYSYSLFILLSWVGLYYGIKYYKMVQVEHEKTLRAEALAHQAQLKMLRYQLNPHFLFNTLNSISTLVLDNRGELANSMISELSKFLRYSLDNEPMQKVSLEKEMAAMDLYLDIEKIRFGDRLSLEIDIDDSARPALIPSLLLQPLIENSIKYAIANSEEGGTINLAARVENGELVLEVNDDGPGITREDCGTSERNGVGLINIRERLNVLYGSGHYCEITNKEPNGLRVKVRIPFETQDENPEWKN